MHNEGATVTVQKALTRLVSGVPLRFRSKFKGDIHAIQQALKLPKENLLVDRRRLRAKPNDPGRLKFQESIKANRKKNYLIQWRDSDGTVSTPCTIEEAAKAVGRTPGSLRVSIARNRGTWDGVVDDRLVTVSRAPLEVPV